MLHPPSFLPFFFLIYVFKPCVFSFSDLQCTSPTECRWLISSAVTIFKSKIPPASVWRALIWWDLKGSWQMYCEKELRGHSRIAEPYSGSHMSCLSSRQRERGFSWLCTLLPSSAEAARIICCSCCLWFLQPPHL